MTIIEAPELERLVRETFPQRARFSAEAELGVGGGAQAAVAFVHGGCDPFLNRLCRAGALAPGDYVVTRRFVAGLEYPRYPS